MPSSPRPRPRPHARARALLAAACLMGCYSQEPDRPPDVVLVVLDTLRPDHLGCYGYDRQTSPHLDALAEDGVLFEHAESAAPWTAPSVASLLTSLHPEVHGVTGYPRPGALPLAASTLAELLSERGYTSAAFTEGGYVSAAFGLDRGFDLFPEQVGAGEGPMENLHSPSRLRDNVESARDWLAARGSAPFFLFFHTYEVHAPLRAPEAFIRRFRPGFDDARHVKRLHEVIRGWNEGRALDAAGARLLRAESFYRALEGAPAIEDRTDLMAAAQALGEPLYKRAAALDEELLAWVRDLYDAEVCYTDAQLLRLWAALDQVRGREGGLDNTLLVIVSDHGEGLGDHGSMGHGSNLFGSLLNTVLIVRAPGVLGAAGRPPTRRVEHLVSLLDVMPTILEVTGAGTEGQAGQGTSLAPLLRGETTGRPREVFGQASHGGPGQVSGAGKAAAHGPDARSVRSGPWRLIRDGPGGNSQLFHLLTDPHELTDLADARPSVVDGLTAILDRQARADAVRREGLGSRAGVPVLDAQTLDELRQLGYLGDE